jgi:hypothetical protein
MDFSWEEVFRAFLVIFAFIGVFYHLLVLAKPQSAQKLEEKLSQEIGARKKFFPWLEDSRMKFHQQLLENKIYNVAALIFLLILLVFLFKTKLLLPLPTAI